MHYIANRVESVESERQKNRKSGVDENVSSLLSSLLTQPWQTFSAQMTSMQRRARRIDVNTTSCARWDLTCLISITAGVRRLNSAVLTSMRRDDVLLTSVRHHVPAGIAFSSFCFCFFFPFFLSALPGEVEVVIPENKVSSLCISLP